MLRAGQVQIIPELCTTKMKDWKKFLKQAFDARMKAYKARKRRERDGGHKAK